MKIVINTCYGGFGISVEALKQLVKMKASCIESTTPKKYYGGENENFKHRDWEGEWKKDFSRYTDIGDGFMTDPTRQYNIYKDGFLYDLKDRHESEVRTDKDLISVIEKLGKKADGSHAQLKIVEIPDKVLFIIEEYDGVEHIAKQHQTWS